MTGEIPLVSETVARVNYSETDQMGVVYHARYLVWLDIARTDHLRRTGMTTPTWSGADCGSRSVSSGFDIVSRPATTIW